MRRLLGPQRNGKEERAALAYLALDPDPPPVHLDDLLGDAQAQPRPSELASDGRVDLTELREHILELFLRNPHSGIRHPIDELAAGELDPDLDPPLLGELDGIAGQ